MIVPAMLLPLAVLAGCGASNTATSAPTNPAAAQPAPDGSSPETVTPEDVPGAARIAYLAGLEEIDPGLIANKDRAINRATNICLDITQGKNESTVVDNARQRLSGGSATIDNAQAARAVALARQHICTA